MKHLTITYNKSNINIIYLPQDPTQDHPTIVSNFQELDQAKSIIDKIYL